jgi:hypothetical protein
LVVLTGGVATASAASATVQAFTLFVDFAGKSMTQGVYFDDLALCQAGDASAEVPSHQRGCQLD